VQRQLLLLLPQLLQQQLLLLLGSLPPRLLSLNLGLQASHFLLQGTQGCPCGPQLALPLRQLLPPLPLLVLRGDYRGRQT
jgi:hypothetical protein